VLRRFGLDVYLIAVLEHLLTWVAAGYRLRETWLYLRWPARSILFTGDEIKMAFPDHTSTLYLICSRK
jgi:hypothetical protein